MRPRVPRRCRSRAWAKTEQRMWAGASAAPISPPRPQAGRNYGRGLQWGWRFWGIDILSAIRSTIFLGTRIIEISQFAMRKILYEQPDRLLTNNCLAHIQTPNQLSITSIISRAHVHGVDVAVQPRTLCLVHPSEQAQAAYAYTSISTVEWALHRLRYSMTVLVHVAVVLDVSGAGCQWCWSLHELVHISVWR